MGKEGAKLGNIRLLDMLPISPGPRIIRPGLANDVCLIG